MKRAKKEESPPLLYAGGRGGIEFILIPEARTEPSPIPLVPVDFGGYYQGQVKIVTAPHCPDLVGLSVLLICVERLPFCAPYYIYHCPSNIVMDAQAVLSGQDRRMRLLKDDSGSSVCRVSRYKPQWTRADAQYALEECSLSFTQPSIMQPIAQRRLNQKAFPVEPAHLLSFEWLSQHSLVGKGTHLSTVFEAFLHQRWDQKNRHRLATLSFQQLQALAASYQDEPWELVWKTVMESRFAKLKPMDRISSGKKEPVEVHYALKLKWGMRPPRASKDEKEAGDTLFGFDRMGPLFPCLPLEQRKSLERRVYEYCQTRDIMLLPLQQPQQHPYQFAFKDDYADAVCIITQLKRIKQNAEETAAVPFSLRSSSDGMAVPVIPPRLTDDQYGIAQHITKHWISIVMGSPGTGKTAIITWLLSHYKKALAVGFVGMLVKMLQRRNGRRRELAYTIDHLRCCGERLLVPTLEWLSYFEVLVIDECSNVSMGRLCKLFPLFKKLRKIIFVGDINQLKSMKPGDAFGDLVRSFPLHCSTLTENLRVAPGLRTLQEVPGHILNNRWQSIEWGNKAWETPVSSVDPEQHPQGGGPKAMIKSLLAKLLLVDRQSAVQLLSTQILVLTHKGHYGRMEINDAAQTAYEELGILQKPSSPSQVFTLHKKCSIYVGCKITFKRNYNHPIEKKVIGKGGKEIIIRSDPVANGELVVVRKIWKTPQSSGGICMEVSDSSDATEASTKTVWINAAEAVDPKNVQCGNAITVYSSQGREFQNVIFCVDPQVGSHWTRANAYVAASRAQQRLVVMGSQKAFGAICARPNVERRTVFAHLLSLEAALTQHVPTDAAAAETIVRDPKTLNVLHKDVLAAPMFGPQ